MDGLSVAERDATTIVTGMLALWLGFGLWWIYFDLVGGRLPRANRVALANWVLSHLPIALAITAAGAGMVSQIPDEPVSVEVRPNGPLFVRGRVRITRPGGEVGTDEVRVALCRCGASQNKPFCDNSHRLIGFRG